MDDIIYIYIAKELDGEATETERIALQNWIVADEKNRDVYNKVKQAWQQAGDVLATPEFDTAGAWNKVSQKIDLQPAHTKTIKMPVWKYGLAAAALLAIGIFIFRQNSGREMEVIAGNTSKTVVLPDNSVVTLKKGSRLRYPKEFTSKERNITLEGEAFFEVTRNEQSPFVVDAEPVSVKVLGTSFNVKCNAQHASVVVCTGKVQMTDNKNKAHVILTPGERGALNNGILQEENVNLISADYWKTGVLNFTNKPLEDIARELSVVKDTAITIDADMPAALRQQLVNITFKDQNLADILSDLCLVTECKWVKANDTYVIRGK